MACEKCKGSGFVSYYRKDGTLVPGIRVHCVCYEEREQYCAFTPDLIDFPVSHDWHRHYQRYYGQADPGSLEPQVHTVGDSHIGMGDKALEANRSMFRALNQRMLSLEKGQYAKQAQYVTQKKGYIKPQPQGYVGLKEEQDGS